MNRTLACSLLLLLLAVRGASADEPERKGERLAPAGPATPLITNADRQRVGLRNGPDSIVDLWHGTQGDYLVFSGLRSDGTHGTFRIGTDAALTHVKAGGPQDLETVLAPACQHAGNARNAAPRAPGSCQDFDSDYAGGGTVFACPGGPTLYFYHGENHTDPAGTLYQGPESGWTGIGVARWDERARRFDRVGEVVGMALSNDWHGERGAQRTLQGPPISGNPSIVQAPGSQDLLLVFADRGSDGDAAAEDAHCDNRTCTAIARAALKDVCGADTRHALDAWRIFHRGRFDSPAVLGAHATSRAVAATGGPFTPVQARWHNLGETTPNVTWLPGRHEFVQVAVANDGQILVRHSSDAIAWTQPYPVPYATPPGRRVMYARLLVGADPSRPVLTFVERDSEGWRDAALMRMPLAFSAKVATSGEARSAAN